MLDKEMVPKGILPGIGHVAPGNEAGKLVGIVVYVPMARQAGRGGEE
jgi:hypothetical protein